VVSIRKRGSPYRKQDKMRKRTRLGPWLGSSLALLSFVSVAKADFIFNYNVIVTGTLTTGSNHVDGSTFVDNLVSNGQPVFAMSTLAGTGDTLNVAGSVSGSGLTLDNGTFVHSGALPGGFSLVLNGNAPDVLNPSLSISPLAGQITSTAAYYNGLTVNSTATSSGQNLTFNPTGTGLSVYSITGSTLSQQNENISINLANNSQAVLIEVPEVSVNFGNSEHISINGGTVGQVLWYFPSASTISVNDPWNGAIFAPGATLSNNNQNINGGVYVENFTNSAEVHLPAPTSSLFAVPEPSAGMLAVGALALGARRPRRRTIMSR
jgi:choice-of-anchor A domain-containing protein